MDTFELLEGTNMTLPNKIFPKLRSKDSTKPIQPVVRTKPGNLCRIVKFALALPGMASDVSVLHSDSSTTLMWKLLPSATLDGYHFRPSLAQSLGMSFTGLAGANNDRS